MALPSEEEKAVLEKFREAIKGTDLQLSERQQSDMSLVVWLRDTDMDVPRALDRLTKNFVWRKEHDMDNILTWKAPESYHKMFPIEICGKAKDGSPAPKIRDIFETPPLYSDSILVVIMHFGRWDVRTSVEAGEKDLYLRYVLQWFATMEEETYKNTGARDPKLPPVSQCIFVPDFGGFGIRQLTSVANVQTCMEVATTLQSHYPDIMLTMCFSNTPRIFPILFSMLKPLLGARILSRTQIFTTANQNKCNEALLKLIAPDQLPIAFGGTNVNACKFDHVGPVEPEVEEEGMESITTDVPAGQDFILEYDIGQEYTLLEWSFRTDAHNIGFCVTHNTKYEVVPYAKYDAHLEKQTGSYMCEKPGIYALTFDNKYSQFRGKTLHFAMSVSEPEDTQL